LFLRIVFPNYTDVLSIITLVIAVIAHVFTSQADEFEESSARKLKTPVFWYRKPVMLVEFMQDGTSVTSEMYPETL
jgi:hypothetical protein